MKSIIHPLLDYGLYLMNSSNECDMVEVITYDFCCWVLRCVMVFFLLSLLELLFWETLSSPMLCGKIHVVRKCECNEQVVNHLGINAAAPGKSSDN